MNGRRLYAHPPGWRRSLTRVGSPFQPQPQPPVGRRLYWDSWLRTALASSAKLLLQRVRWALSRAPWTAGMMSPRRMAMIAMTTSNSVRVNPPRRQCWDPGENSLRIVKSPNEIRHDADGIGLASVPRRGDEGSPTRRHPISLVWKASAWKSRRFGSSSELSSFL